MGPKIYKDGSPDNIARIVILYWKPVKINKNLKEQKPWEQIKYWNTETTRDKGIAELPVGDIEMPQHLFSYVFFTSEKYFSNSKSASLSL